MKNISPFDRLKNSIQTLEAEQAIKEQLLREQFSITYESLKPINLIKSVLNDITSSPYLLDNILSTSVGLATGYVSKKVVVGSSGNVFRKLMGSVLQFGVTNIVSQHPDLIKAFGQYLIEHIFRKKEKEIKF